MKTKYRLYVANQLRYFFVTTKLSLDDSIKELLKIADSCSYSRTTSYRITKVENGEDIILVRGKIKATY